MLKNRKLARAWVPGLADYDAWRDYANGYGTLGNALLTSAGTLGTLVGLGGLMRGAKSLQGAKAVKGAKTPKVTP
ncbi:MAG: hypothetical protein HUJ56_05965 [Erysipelotrichaceae bacterium]|nr:hypothetical protein [Erysipelotrichaceae bacterium]